MVFAAAFVLVGLLLIGTGLFGLFESIPAGLTLVAIGVATSWGGVAIVRQARRRTRYERLAALADTLATGPDGTNHEDLRARRRRLAEILDGRRPAHCTLVHGTRAAFVRTFIDSPPTVLVEVEGGVFVFIDGPLGRRLVDPRLQSVPSGFELLRVAADDDALLLATAAPDATLTPFVHVADAVLGPWPNGWETAARPATGFHAGADLAGSFRACFACARCQYRLETTGSPRCPECGLAFPSTA